MPQTITTSAKSLVEAAERLGVDVQMLLLVDI